jgi:hypothetical protein
MSDFEFGPGGVRRFATGSPRSIIGDGVGTIRYPSPFFDIAHTYMPASFKTMLRWCRFYFLTNPLINAAVYKMAEYPVTDLIFDTDNDPLKQRWSYFFHNVLNFKKFEVEVGLDYNTYGNCFISIFYPFQKYLICKQCDHAVRVDKQKYKFQEFKFHGTCQKCRHYGEFNVRDQYIRSAKDIRLVRWNPEQISIHHNDATGETLYYYTIPAVLGNDIRMAKRHVIEKTPQVFIEALKLNKNLLFNKDNIYHMKRPTIAQKDKGWGLPMILPVLKDTFYLQILRKAQEAIAVEHIVPLRILFPQTAGPTSDVYSTVNLSSWKLKIEQEILRWRLDNNYIPILPLPVGQQTLGAEGRALMLAQEYRVWAEHIIAGMGVPVEFVFGGMQFSGSNVSLRILENHFLDYKADHHALVQDFIMPNVGAFMGWQPVKTHFRRFKMADDLQRSAYHFQLNQAGKLSDKSLLEETDWDAGVEAERIAEESKKVLENQRRQALAQAAIQGEAQLIMQKYQFRAQKAMESQMQPAAGAPGQASPAAQGQAQLQEQQQALTTGQFQDLQAPSAAPADSGGLPADLQSPLNESQVMHVDPGAVTLGLQDIAERVARMLDQMPEAERQPHLVSLRRNNPQLYMVVNQMLQVRRGSHTNSAAMPAPQNKPARRGPEAVAA